jgi:hypothetical protein
MRSASDRNTTLTALQLGMRLARFLRLLEATSKSIERSRTNLQIVLERLDPILIPHGFHCEMGDAGVSSSGSFANGFYKRGPIEIGLIMRGDALGSPNYGYQGHSASHDELVEALGRTDGVLRFDRRFDHWKLVTVDGRPILDALVSDLEAIIVPTILENPTAYTEAIGEARTRRMRDLLGSS